MATNVRIRCAANWSVTPPTTTSTSPSFTLTVTQLPSCCDYPVNPIAAGFVDTPLSASLLGDRIGELREQLRATLPIGRVVGPADIAALPVHLMTNTAVTCATFDIDGGQQLIGA